MKRGIILILALALVLVFAMSAVAVAVPGNGNAGGNDNPLGELRSSQVDKGAMISAYVHALPDGATFGSEIAEYKEAAGFKAD